MNRGFRIGRLFGIAINVDWSWLVIFGLVTWNLGTAFGAFHPEWRAATSWALAVSASVLLFASVLAHELAHSIFARSRGIPVETITLFMFGGASNIGREPDSPGSEFVMAILGPASSFVIGFLILAFTRLAIGPLGAGVGNPAQALGGLGPLPTMLIWLGSVNVVLGVFNLIPGFPLDGGRVLRSIIWAVTGSLRRATRYASWAGQGIAFALIAVGIAMVFGARVPVFGTGIGGLWLALVGMFLNSAAVQSYRQVVLKDALDGVPVKQVALATPPTVPARTRVSDFVQDYVMRSDDNAFGVVDEGAFIGLVTLDDVRALPRDGWDAVRVRDIMTPVGRLITVGPEEDAADALSKLTQRDVLQLPVVASGDLVGLLRRRDIMRWLQLHARPA